MVTSHLACVEAVPSIFGRIALVAELIQQREAEGPTATILRETHTRLVHDWLAATLEFRVGDMVEYLRGFGERCVEATIRLLQQENDDALLPVDLDELHREHFAREMEMLLPLVIVQLPDGVPLAQELTARSRRTPQNPERQPERGLQPGLAAPLF